jgi:acyl carrier protein
LKLTEILNSSFGSNETGLRDETTLMSLPDWDSMSHMYFITQLEELYEIDLTGDEIADMKTVGDIKNLILLKGKEL